ncbi:MAG: hypothetical protein EHM64_08075 [Ignavibacteriae bacterium]|nr:MAG: hypothetical protein EHM64_08075 [Ignavibacteriota bacterium]
MEPIFKMDSINGGLPMEISPNNYYHIYNRSNNLEVAFKSSENYDYFLSKYCKYLGEMVDTLAYCLMPTHFHFLVFIRSEKTDNIRDAIGVMQSSYTTAINKRYDRHGSLFQLHTKAKLIERDESLFTITTYIHQNPVRAGLVKKLEDWEYSSYREYIGLKNNNVINTKILRENYSSIEEFKIISEEMLSSVQESSYEP